MPVASWKHCSSLAIDLYPCPLSPVYSTTAATDAPIGRVGGGETGGTEDTKDTHQGQLSLVNHVAIFHPRQIALFADLKSGNKTIDLRSSSSFNAV